jgi:hypothetical protein
MRFSVIFAVILSCSVNRRKLPIILSKFYKVDKLLENKERLVFYKTENVRLRRNLILCTGLLLLSGVNVYINFKGSLLGLFVILTHSMFLELSEFTVLQYIVLVRVLHRRYIIINNRLAAYFKTQNVTTRLPVIGFDPLNISCVSSHTAQVVPVSSTRDASSELYIVREMRPLCVQLYDAAALMGSKFGIPSLLETLSFAIFCIVFVNFELNLLETGADFRTIFNNTYILITVGTSLVYFGFLTQSCHQTTEEVNKIVISIQRILALSGVRYRTQGELEMFSTQMKEMQISFVVCGFFNLNLPFFGTVISLITSYTIIISQLQ